MTTKVYGASDDLVEVEGDIDGEVCKYETDDTDRGVLLVFSDGTLLDVKYGKSDLGLWGITLIKKGDLFDKIEPATDEDDNYSDIAHFKDGLKWAYAGTEWEPVR